MGNCSVGEIIWNDRVGKGTAWKPWKMRQLRHAEDQLWYGTGVGWGDRNKDSTHVRGVDNYGPPAPGPGDLGLPPRW